MSDIAITVENLSKLYKIGAKQEGYKTLRDSIMSAVSSPFRRLSSAVGDSSSVVRPRSSVVYNDTIWALKDVSFEVKRGEVIGIIGRNGAGKTTLLKILSRITEPTEGLAEIHGRVSSLLEVGTGFHPELTGRENIYLNGAILGMKKSEIERKFNEIVAFSEVEKFIDTPVKHYSSGMYVRLAFAVAAHLEPEILLVDEVLAVGDVAFQRKCLGKMGKIAKEGRTVIFVSHNMAAVNDLCCRSILLSNGSIIMDSTPHKVIGFYLKSTYSLSRSKDFDEDPNKQIQFRSISILNTNVSTEENLCINISYQVHHEVVGAHVGCYIKDGYDNWILASTDCDLKQDNLLLKRSIGLFYAKIEIPGGLLNDGQYYIVVGTAVHNVELFDWQEGPSFTIFKTKTNSAISVKESIHALLGIKLPWKVEQVNNI